MPLPHELQTLIATSALVTGTIHARRTDYATVWDNGATAFRDPLPATSHPGQYRLARWERWKRCDWDNGASTFDGDRCQWDTFSRAPWDAGASYWDDGYSTFDATHYTGLTKWVIQRAPQRGANARTATGEPVSAYRYQPHYTPRTTAYQNTLNDMRAALDEWAANATYWRGFVASLPNPRSLSAYHLFLSHYLTT